MIETVEISLKLTNGEATEAIAEWLDRHYEGTVPASAEIELFNGPCPIVVKYKKRVIRDKKRVE